jgi:signal transduction histidine kinase
MADLDADARRIVSSATPCASQQILVQPAVQRGQVHRTRRSTRCGSAGQNTAPTDDWLVIKVIDTGIGIERR